MVTPEQLAELKEWREQLESDGHTWEELLAFATDRLRSGVTDDLDTRELIKAIYEAQKALGEFSETQN